MSICPWKAIDEKSWDALDDKTWNDWTNQADECKCAACLKEEEDIENHWIEKRKAWGCISACGGRDVKVECEVCDREFDKRFTKFMTDTCEFYKRSKLIEWARNSSLIESFMMRSVIRSIRDPEGEQLIKEISPNTFQVLQCPTRERLRAEGAMVRVWARYINETPYNQFVCRDNKIFPRT